MKHVSVFSLATLSLFFIPFSGYTQDQDQDQELAVKIYNDNKDSAVDVKTELEIEKLGKAGTGGSGFFIDEEGHILTNAHVVKVENDEIGSYSPFGSSVYKILKYKYEVTLSSRGRKYEAELVGWDFNTDTAILKVKGIKKGDYKMVKLGDSAKMRVGEAVYALGAPLGSSNSFTPGNVTQIHYQFPSNPDRGIEPMNYIEDFIQTNAAINRGNSGGMLLNKESEVIGITSAKYIDAAVDNMGYAIPINLVKIERLKQGGEIKKPVFGAECLLKNFPRFGEPEKPKFKDLEFVFYAVDVYDEDDVVMLTTICNATYTDHYAIVISLEPNSPAVKAGLKKADIVVKCAGKNIASGMDLRLELINQTPGKPFELEVWRAEGKDLKILKLTAVVEEEKK